MHETPAERDAIFLIVDDEPDICWSLERVISKAGFRAAVAETGLGALELVTRSSFELAFVDAKLPDIEGMELARQFQSIRPNLRIVLISGYFYEDDHQVQRWIREGLICGFIGKPFSLEQIRNLVRTARQYGVPPTTAA